jgi:hypothetical protein
MKKLGLIVVAVLLAVGLVAVAEMDNKDYNFTVVAANAYTNAYTLRGEVKAVEIDIATGSTQAVVITSGQATLFTKTCTADARYDLLYPAYSSAAAALTFVGGTNNTANAWQTRGVVAGPVTVVATGDAGQTKTNALKVTVIYNK